MSLFAFNSGTPQTLSIDADAAAGIGPGPYTVAILYKRTTSGGGNVAVWTAYQPDDFVHRGVFIDSNDLYPPAVGGSADANLLRDDTTWYWIVISKASATEAVRYHWAPYASSGSLTWTHVDGDTTTIPAQGPQVGINRLFFGDPNAGGFGGHVAAIAAWESELADATIEAACTQTAQDTLDATPDVFVLAPEASAGSPLVDTVAGGSGELTRTANWTTSADPAGYNFTVSGADNTPPTVPTNLIASNVTDSSFALTWTVSTDDTAVTGYQSTLDGGSTFSEATRGGVISGLAGGGTYSVSVRAYDAANNSSAWSTPLSVTTLESTAVSSVRVGGAWVSIKDLASTPVESTDHGSIGATLTIADSGIHELDLTVNAVVTVSTAYDVTIFAHSESSLSLTVAGTVFTVDGDAVIFVVTSPRGVQSAYTV